MELEAAVESRALPPSILALLRTGFDSPLAGEQIAAAVELRGRLAETYPSDRLRAYLHDLRCRVHLLEGGAAPEKLDPAASDASLLAGIRVALDDLKLIYSFVSERDARVSQIRLWALGLLGVLYGTLLVIYLAWLCLSESRAIRMDGFAVNSVLNYALVAAVAAGGAAISILQRSQDHALSSWTLADPVVHISALRHGMVGVMVSGLAGPALAMILVPLFASGLVTIGELTPTFELTCNAPIANFQVMDHRVCLSRVDAPKMLVWAFLAGFAERLVPDVLDRLVGRAAAGDGKA